MILEFKKVLRQLSIFLCLFLCLYDIWQCIEKLVKNPTSTFKNLVYIAYSNQLETEKQIGCAWPKFSWLRKEEDLVVYFI